MPGGGIFGIVFTRPRAADRDSLEQREGERTQRSTVASDPVQQQRVQAKAVFVAPRMEKELRSHFNLLNFHFNLGVEGSAGGSRA
jgi:hypothetical protein